MPLSEHEQRLLEQIEQALYAEDPKFASIYQGNDVRTHYRRRVVRAVIGLVIGLGVMVAGVVIQQVPLGVAGFVIMVAAVSFGVASWQRMTGHRVSVTRDRPPRGGGRGRGRGSDASRGGRSGHPAGGSKRGVVGKLEDRWQRRQDERDNDR